MIEEATEARQGDPTVYIVTPRGTLHQGAQSKGGILTNEQDNLDAVLGKMNIYDNFAEAVSHATNWCKRCFPTTKEPDAIPLEHETEQATD